MASQKPPSFDKLEYWDNRYSQTSKSYDWLNTHEILDEQIDSALALAATSSPRILHVGCGNSELSFHLRFKVKNPEQIQNLDYSSVAIEWGREREKQMFDFGSWEGQQDGEDRGFVSPEFSMPMMDWTVVDLLEITSIISTCALGAYSLVVDKGTSDSLACTSSTEVSLPYFLCTDKDDGDHKIDVLKTTLAHVSTLQVLAVHLALLAQPKARWIIFSYSSTRFAFFDNAYDEYDDVPRVLKMHPKIPHPKHLWKVIHSQPVVKPYSSEAPESENFHFIYVLERTEESLNVRSI